MAEPVVIGMDSSTQSTKAIAWDRTGHAVSEGRAPVALDNPRHGWFEQDSDEWCGAARKALADCVRGLDGRPVSGLSIANQRETMAYLDREGRAVRPATVWLDERARAEVGELVEALGGEFIHRTTGRPIDVIPALYRIAWLRKHEPDAHDRIALYADVQSVLVMDLCGGPARTGWASADPLGLFDIHAKSWSVPILDAVGIGLENVAEAHPPATKLGGINAEAAEATGLPSGCPVFAGGGDGQLAGLGTDCTMPNRAYANLGTAVVSGTWRETCFISEAFRTEIAGQGSGYIHENCLRSGVFLLNWFIDRFLGGRDDHAVFDRLEREAGELPIGSEGVLVQPWWGGVMDPYWDQDARGLILGLSGSHGPVHIYRAILEGITIWLASATARTEAETGQEIDHYLAIGGGANSVLWRQMLADASGRPVRISPTIEASALGAGMLAATGAGWFDRIEDAAAEMSGASTGTEPDPRAAERYGELAGIFADAYGATSDITHRLVALAEKPRWS